MIFGNDVAQICLRFPSLLNFLGFLGFLILGRQISMYLPNLQTSSGVPGRYQSRQVSLDRHPVKHPFAILENSTLRRDWNFVLILRHVSLNIHSVDLRL